VCFRTIHLKEHVTTDGTVEQLLLDGSLVPLIGLLCSLENHIDNCCARSITLRRICVVSTVVVIAQNVSELL